MIVQGLGFRFEVKGLEGLRFEVKGLGRFFGDLGGFQGLGFSV